MGLIRPAHINVNAGVVGRLGRFVHWLALAAALCSAGMAVVCLFAVPDDQIKAYMVVLFVGIGAVIAAVGRGLRYVLAGE